MLIVKIKIKGNTNKSQNAHLTHIYTILLQITFVQFVQFYYNFITSGTICTAINGN